MWVPSPLPQRLRLGCGTKTPFHSGELPFHVVQRQSEQTHQRHKAATVTGIRDFPSEGFSLNLLPEASPGERVWTQQSSGFKATATSYVPGRRWRMSPSFLLKLHRGFTGRENTEKRDLVRESGDLGCRSAPLVMSWVPTSFFGHILFQRERSAGG